MLDFNHILHKITELIKSTNKSVKLPEPPCKWILNRVDHGDFVNFLAVTVNFIEMAPFNAKLIGLILHMQDTQASFLVYVCMHTSNI